MRPLIAFIVLIPFALAACVEYKSINVPVSEAEESQFDSRYYIESETQYFNTDDYNWMGGSSGCIKFEDEDLGQTTLCGSFFIQEQ